MRAVACTFSALLLVASAAAPAGAQTQPKTPKPHAKKERPQETAAPRGDEYRGQLADKLPIGSSAWWEQMRREGRLGGETP